MTAFIGGATGYTGRAVVAALRERGHRAIAHVRPGAANAAEWRARFAALGAEVDESPWEPVAINAALVRHRPDHVFALLGTTRRRAAREGLTDAYEKVDYGLTALLRDAAIACGTAPRFSYLSAMGANEASGNKYLEVRGRIERELREGPLPWLVAQPAFVSGSDREEFRLTERLFTVSTDLLLGAMRLVGFGSLRDRYASLTGVQLARGMVALALAEREGRRVASVRDLRAAAR